MSLIHKLARHFRGPRCHVNAEQKQWVEERLLWLRRQFGPEPIRRPPLDPSSELLPRKWDRSREAGADLFGRLCKFMLIDSIRVQLQYYTRNETHEQGSAYAGNRHASGPAGLFVHPTDNKRLIIALEQSGLDQPASLAATICHELAHVHLLADERISRDADDCEPLTDLLTIFFGAGIFTANSAFRFGQWQSHSHQGWSSSRLGYLSEEVLGYALACYAWYRGERQPGWSRHLRSNILYYFDDSLHFLSAGGESKIPFNGVEQLTSS